MPSPDLEGTESTRDSSASLFEPFLRTPFTHAFTTSAALHRHLPSALLVPLADDALGVHKVMAGVTRRIVIPPSPLCPDDPSAKAWEALFPSGSYNPSGPIRGGLGFYASGSDDFSKALENAETTEVLVSYSVMFEEGFDWVKGGKLPGVFGGVGDRAYRCSGGRQEDRCKCFDFRLMFRANGSGELYANAPLTENNAASLLAVPNSCRNKDYGISVGRGLFSLHSGAWTSVTIRVKLNTVGSEDGQVEVYIDGKSIMRVTGLTLRDDPTARVKGMHFQTFFGGSTPDWATPRDQYSWFGAVSGGIVHSFSPP